MLQLFGADPRLRLPTCPSLTPCAFAVLLVIVHHWCGPADSPLGPIGVWIFFVLSGFLITRILLDSRSDSPGANRQAIVRFYIRRILRIFPLYYLVLLLAFVTSTTFRSHWSWYAAYLQNFWMIRATSDEQIFGPHLWSLAVEEQFYVVWPRIGAFCPPRCAAGDARVDSGPGCCLPVHRYRGGLDTIPGIRVHTMQLRYARPRGAARVCRQLSQRPGRAVAPPGLRCGSRHPCANALLHIPLLNFSTMALPTGCMTFWFIARVVGGVDGIAGRVLRFPPSVYLGRISYGIYVYHYFVPETLTVLLRRCHLELDGAPFLAICFIVTVVVASVSWFFFEKPVRSLKDRLYTRAPRSGPGRSPPAGPRRP